MTAKARFAGHLYVPRETDRQTSPWGLRQSSVRDFYSPIPVLQEVLLPPSCLPEVLRALLCWPQGASGG